MEAIMLMSVARNGPCSGFHTSFVWFFLYAVADIYSHVGRWRLLRRTGVLSPFIYCQSIFSVYVYVCMYVLNLLAWPTAHYSRSSEIALKVFVLNPSQFFQFAPTPPPLVPLSRTAQGVCEIFKGFSARQLVWGESAIKMVPTNLRRAGDTLRLSDGSHTKQ